MARVGTSERATVVHLSATLRAIIRGRTGDVDLVRNDRVFHVNQPELDKLTAARDKFLNGNEGGDE